MTLTSREIAGFSTRPTDLPRGRGVTTHGGACKHAPYVSRSSKYRRAALGSIGRLAYAACRWSNARSASCRTLGSWSSSSSKRAGIASRARIPCNRRAPAALRRTTRVRVFEFLDQFQYQSVGLNGHSMIAAVVGTTLGLSTPGRRTAGRPAVVCNSLLIGNSSADSRRDLAPIAVFSEKLARWDECVEYRDEKQSRRSRSGRATRRRKVRSCGRTA